MRERESSREREREREFVPDRDAITSRLLELLLLFSTVMKSCVCVT